MTKYNKIISGKNISIGYSKSKNSLHSNLSFDLYEGELTCLLGANGVGKSTLLKTISVNKPALKGNIYFKEKDITTFKEKDLSQLMGLVLTDQTNVGGLTMRELVSLGRYSHTGFFGKLSDNDHLIVNKAMGDVNILHKADAYMSEVSDGERQKAMIAKAICQQCPILLLDEPTAFLDIEGRMEIMNLLHNLSMKQKKTILISTHDIDLALRLADRLWLLSRDKGLDCGVTEDIVFSGRIDNFFKNEAIVFNKQNGNFVSIVKGEKNAVVHSEEHLAHWCKNILMRHGFRIIDKEEESSIIMKASDANSIIINKDGESHFFTNFEQVANWLRYID